MLIPNPVTDEFAEVEFDGTMLLQLRATTYMLYDIFYRADNYGKLIGVPDF